MVSILPPERSQFDVLGRDVGRALQSVLPGAVQQGYQQGLLNQQRMAVSNQLGPEIARLPPELQKLYVADILKNQRMQKEQNMLKEVFGGASQGTVPVSSTQDNQNAPGNQFNVAQIPDEVIASISAMNPNLGRLLQQQKDVGLREKRAQEEFALKTKKASPEHQREEHIASSQAQADVKYNQQLQEAAKQHELKEQSLDRLEKLNKQGVTGKPYEKLLEKMGLVAFTSEGRREFAADVKNLITDIRSILGSQFTGFEFQTILNAYPSADFSKEANNAIIKNLKNFQDIKSKEVEFANQIKRENKGKIPVDFQARVNEKVHEYGQSKLPEIKENAKKIMNEEYGIKPGFVLMFDPSGEPLNVPEDKVQEMIGHGAILP